MNGVVCLVPSKFGQCTLLAGHDCRHKSTNGDEWDETDYQKPVEKAIETPVKRGRGRPRKWFKDDKGKWYKVE